MRYKSYFLISIMVFGLLFGFLMEGFALKFIDQITLEAQAELEIREEINNLPMIKSQGKDSLMNNQLKLDLFSKIDFDIEEGQKVKLDYFVNSLHLDNIVAEAINFKVRLKSEDYNKKVFDNYRNNPEEKERFVGFISQLISSVYDVYTSEELVILPRGLRVLSNYIGNYLDKQHFNNHKIDLNLEQGTLEITFPTTKYDTWIKKTLTKKSYKKSYKKYNYYKIIFDIEEDFIRLRGKTQKSRSIFYKRQLRKYLDYLTKNPPEDKDSYAYFLYFFETKYAVASEDEKNEMYQKLKSFDPDLPFSSEEIFRQLKVRNISILQGNSPILDQVEITLSLKDIPEISANMIVFDAVKNVSLSQPEKSIAIEDWNDMKRFVVGGYKAIEQAESKDMTGLLEVNLDQYEDLSDEKLGFVAFKISSSTYFSDVKNFPRYQNLSEAKKIIYEDVFIKRENKLLENIIESMVEKGDRDTGKIVSIANPTNPNVLESLFYQKLQTGSHIKFQSIDLLKYGTIFMEIKQIPLLKEVGVKNLVLFLKVKVGKNEIKNRLLNRGFNESDALRISEKLKSKYDYILLFARDFDRYSYAEHKALYPMFFDFLSVITNPSNHILPTYKHNLSSQHGFFLKWGIQSQSQDLIQDLVFDNLFNNSLFGSHLALQYGIFGTVQRLERIELFAIKEDSFSTKLTGSLGVEIYRTILVNYSDFIDRLGNFSDLMVQSLFRLIKYGAKLEKQFKNISYESISVTKNYKKGGEFHLTHFVKSLLLMNIANLDTLQNLIDLDINDMQASGGKLMLGKQYIKSIAINNKKGMHLFISGKILQ